MDINKFKSELLTKHVFNLMGKSGALTETESVEAASLTTEELLYELAEHGIFTVADVEKLPIEKQMITFTNAIKTAINRRGVFELGRLKTAPPSLATSATLREEVKKRYGVDTNGETFNGDFVWLNQALVNRGLTASDIGRMTDEKTRKLVKQLKKDIVKLKREAGVRGTGRSTTLLTGTGGAESDQELIELGLGDKRVREFYEEFARWTSGPLRFEKPNGSTLHHLIDFVSRPGIFAVDGNPDVSEYRERERALLHASLVSDACHDFVVEHDWYRAFDGSKNVHEGEYVLPYDFCVFEFRLSGVRVIGVVGYVAENVIHCKFLFGIRGVWIMDPDVYVPLADSKWRIFDEARNKDPLVHGGDYGKVVDLLMKQVRAVCIMLEANVAAPLRNSQFDSPLSRKRAKEGKPPLRDYHVVSLRRRARDPNYVRPETDSGRRSRCHFRIGHWRHFKDAHSGQVPYYDDFGEARSKTRIPWVMAGDPDLGFVDKHYRL